MSVYKYRCTPRSLAYEKNPSQPPDLPCHSLCPSLYPLVFFISRPLPKDQLQQGTSCVL